MDADMRAERRELVDGMQPITDYAKSYAEKKQKYDEFFTEAVRLKTTVPDYLKTNFPEINKFLTDNFPSIKNEDIK
jgi:mRNA-degrading endonuclease HigB of HigAB toxin-antitoxin module